jgi:hypothetical protein
MEFEVKFEELENAVYGTEIQDDVSDLKNAVVKVIEDMKMCATCSHCEYHKGYGYRCALDCPTALYDVREVPEWCEKESIAAKVERWEAVES